MNENGISAACANCGKGEESSIDLKKCNGCKMVKYCSRECQVAHRPQHKKECKERAKELHDEALFKQPPPPEDCPICMLTLPGLDTGSKYYSCCGKVMCGGCIYAMLKGDIGKDIQDNGSILLLCEKKCPFCRTPVPTSEKESLKRDKKRMKVDDAESIYNMARGYYDGKKGLPQDHTKAFELWHRAGELGHAAAYRNIGNCYAAGARDEKSCHSRDENKKSCHYWELGAKKGDSLSRFNLGVCEFNSGSKDRALKHFMIGVISGSNESLDAIRQYYKNGDATKDDYMKALQAYQVYLEDIKSHQRDAAAAFDDQFKYY